MLRLLPLAFYLIWILSYVVRRLKRAPLGGHTSPGPSGQWGGHRGSHGAQSSSNYSPTVPSPYDILGVNPGASESEIRAAYRRQVIKYHPDKVTHLGPEFTELAEQSMKAINSAYAQLRKDRSS